MEDEDEEDVAELEEDVAEFDDDDTDDFCFFLLCGRFFLLCGIMCNGVFDTNLL